MSEHQYVAFRAVDRPLTDKELAFARTQSSRAEISRWSFENEYHFGDFRGDVNKLLHSGFDVYLHYANYGTRNVSLHLPNGLPFPEKVWSPYFGIEGVKWTKDSKGKRGILELSPFYDGGELEEIWEPESFMDEVIELRRRLIMGDLRALYLIWLCLAGSDYADATEIEPPVPVGLDQFIEPCGAVLEFFGLDSLMLAASSEGTPAMSSSVETDPLKVVTDSIDSLSEADVRAVLRRFVTEDASSVKAEVLDRCRDSADIPAWPTVEGTRSFEALLARTSQLRDEESQREKKRLETKARREAEKAEQLRQIRMKEMVKDPQRWLREAEKLANARGTDNYKAAADVLADLREAIGGDEGRTMTDKHAAHLAKKYPTLNHLKSQLRKRGFLS